MTSKPNLSILSINFNSGGAEKVISLLLKKLVDDYNVTLVLFYREIHFSIPAEVNLITFKNKEINSSFFKNIINVLIFAYKYSKIIRSQKINYSISFLPYPNFINGISKIFNNNVKAIISERGYPSDNTTSKLSLFIAKTFYPLLYNRCDKLFSNSIYINRDLIENFRVNIPMEVIYNPIEVPEKTVIPESLTNDNKVLKIITAGTLNIRKNHAMIIKALKSLDPTYQLTIMGDGHLKEYLISLANGAGLKGSVILKGKVKDVNDLLINSDCFVLSSFTEGFPNALLEAMAIGLPCISTNCLSGPQELLHDNKEVEIKNGHFFKATYGLLVNNDDHLGLAEALKYLHTNPTERAKYSALSLHRSKEYLLENIYSSFNNFVQS